MLVLILTSTFLLYGARSELLLTVVPEIVEPDFTPLVTIRCSLLEQEEAIVESISISRISVTQRNATKELVAELRSLAPSTPRLAAGFENVTVRGQISQFELEIGTFLEIVWPDPRTEDLGLYTCDATSIVEEAVLVLTAEVRVTTSGPATDRLLAAVKSLEKHFVIFNESLQQISTRLDNVETAQETAERQNTTEDGPPSEEVVEGTDARETPTEQTPAEETVDESDLEWIKTAAQTLEQAFQSFNESITRLVGQLEALIEQAENDEPANSTETDQEVSDAVRSYFAYGNSSYFLFRSGQSANASDGQGVCERKRLYVAEINDAEEFQAISNEISRFVPEGDLVLVGGRSDPGQEAWIFQNSQEVVNFFAWGGGEPAEISEEGQCLALRKVKDVLEMAAVACSHSGESLHFLCERDE